MFRKYHFTCLLKDRISYSELSVLHKLYVFIPPSGPARTLPHAILWTCDTMLTVRFNIVVPLHAHHKARVLQVLRWRL